MTVRIARRYSYMTVRISLARPDCFFLFSLWGQKKGPQKITAAKATRCLNFLRHTMWSAPCSAKSLAYKSIICPIMEYGCQVWNPHQCGNIDLLERVQRQAAHWSCGSQWNPITLSWSKSSEACLTDLSWPTSTISFYCSLI